LEINIPERHEYLKGEIVLMAGGTPNHNRIAGNLYANLNLACKHKPYDIFIADQRLWIPEKRIATYLDVLLVSGELQLQKGRKDTITNPLMIAEVLSVSTRNYDKDEKFAAYRTISSFQEYLLIDQYTNHVEHYYKTAPTSWVFSEYDNLGDIISFHSFALQISLAELYDKVKFS